jgi:hypothetical protein
MAARSGQFYNLQYGYAPAEGHAETVVMGGNARRPAVVRAQTSNASAAR